MALLIDDFEGFLRVGAVSYAEWDALDVESKAALIEASKRLDAERAVTLARAFADPNAAAARFDGGDSHVRACIRKALDARTRAMEAGR